jgi:hypothetical protein
MCCVCMQYDCLLSDSYLPDACTPPEFMSSGHRSRGRKALPTPPSSPSSDALARRDARVARFDNGDVVGSKASSSKTLPTFPLHADGVYPFVMFAGCDRRVYPFLGFFLKWGFPYQEGPSEDPKRPRRLLSGADSQSQRSATMKTTSSSLSSRCYQSLMKALPSLVTSCKTTTSAPTMSPAAASVSTQA